MTLRAGKGWSEIFEDPKILSNTFLISTSNLQLNMSIADTTRAVIAYTSIEVKKACEKGDEEKISNLLKHGEVLSDKDIYNCFLCPNILLNKDLAKVVTDGIRDANYISRSLSMPGERTRSRYSICILIYIDIPVYIYLHDTTTDTIINI